MMFLFLFLFSKIHYFKIGIDKTFSIHFWQLAYHHMEKEIGVKEYQKMMQGLWIVFSMQYTDKSTASHNNPHLIYYTSHYMI
jgi:hypothetical protein